MLQTSQVVRGSAGLGFIQLRTFDRKPETCNLKPIAVLVSGQESLESGLWVSTSIRIEV